MSQGNIVQCIGAVVDIQFPREQMPKVYDALLLDEHSRSDTYPTNLTREYYVPKPASDQAVIDAAAATAAAAQTNGWTQTVTGANLWVGEKRDGDQLLRLRIDTDLLVGASGTYVDDKAGFVKVLIMKVDR